MIATEITAEEADCRLHAAEDAPVLPEPMIDRIVSHTTQGTRAPVLPTPPRFGAIQPMPGWRQLSNVAAAGTFTALLLSAGLAVTLWPESSYSTDTLRYDYATRMMTDSGDSIERRMIALGTTFPGIRRSIRAMKAVADERGEVGRVANELILGLQLAIRAPGDLPLLFGTVDRLEPLEQIVRDPSLPSDERVEALQMLGDQSLAGLSCMFEAEAIGGDDQFDQTVKLFVAKLKLLLRD